uniref:Late endosomal/lysosomal adaptor and MAPK and MTOR activator 5 n=1 Tax=Anopheles coluzzii TaxID=1518534 RepID=A0A8W7PY49_ANOCL
MTGRFSSLHFVSSLMFFSDFSMMCSAVPNSPWCCTYSCDTMSYPSCVVNRPVAELIMLSHSDSRSLKLQEVEERRVAARPAGQHLEDQANIVVGKVAVVLQHHDVQQAVDLERLARAAGQRLQQFTGNGPISSGLTMMNSSGPGSSSSVTSRTCFIHRIVLTLPKLSRSCRTTTSGIHQSILSCSGTSCGRSRRYSRCVTVAVRFAYDRTTRTIGMRSLVIHELTTSFTVTDSHSRWSRWACLVSASHTSSP